MTTAKEKRSNLLVGAVILVCIGAVLDFVGIATPEPMMATIGGIVVIIGAVLILAWFVNYLHELDGRLAHVEDWLEESTKGEKRWHCSTRR